MPDYIYEQDQRHNDAQAMSDQASDDGSERATTHLSLPDIPYVLGPLRLQARD